MEEIKKEVVVGYKSYDGQEFTNIEECKKYEESAKGVLAHSYSKAVILSDSEWNIFGFGSEEDIVDIVKVTADNANIIKQYMILLGNNYKMEEKFNLIDSAAENGEYLVINRGYDRDNFWIIDTLQRLANKPLDLVNNSLKNKHLNENNNS